MRELKLKYFLDLVSNVGAKAQADAKLMQQAQEAMNRAIVGTNDKFLDYNKLALMAGKNTGLMQEVITGATNKFVAMERALDRVGHNTSLERQGTFVQALTRRYVDLRKAVEGSGAAMTAVAKIGVSAVAGGAAAAYTVDRIAKAPMEYSLRLAHMANTAFSDRGVAGRIEGKRTLDAGVKAAVRVGGGTRDDAAEALDNLIASGAVPIDAALKMLPGLMRAATASGASAKGLSTIALRSLQAGVKAEQIPEVLNMAMVAGQAGGFELKDMEKWLASAIASGKGIGLTGVEGVRRLLGSMQASVVTAGTKDEAGNNVVNLLNKINSEDTAKDFAKQGIDLRKELLTGVAKGGNALDTFLGLVDRVTEGVHKAPEFKALSARLKQEGDTGQETDTTTALRDLFQGTAISKVVQDRQALMALVAELNNRDYVQRVMQQTRDNRSAMDTSFSVIGNEVAFTRQQAINEAQIGAQEAFGKAAPALNAVAGTAADLAQRFPTLTTVVMAATGALTVFAAGLGAAGLAGMLTGGAGAGTLKAFLARLGLGAAGAGAAGAGAAAGGATAAGLMLPAAAAGAGLFAGWQVTRLFGALGDLNAAKNREGVKLTPYAQRRLAGLPEPKAVDFSQVGLPQTDYLSLTAPGPTAEPLGAPKPMDLKVGEGRLAVDVRITDDRVSATTSVMQQPSLVRIDAGNTNPAGYARGTRGGA